jgi:seryl-tRNA synthetase
MLETYQWYDNGLSVIGGDLLKLYRAIDQCFVKWATVNYDAQEYLFPTFIKAAELGKISYFHSFPHLATFPICLSQREENLKRFIEGEPLSLAGEIQLTDTEPIREILTPAACYHLYLYLQGRDFTSSSYFTTVNNCFRRENHYLPLQRQWNFHMREIVCLGSRQTVETFLAQSRNLLTQFCQYIGLPIEWETATDPFFQPDCNPKYIAQIVTPTKMEMLFNGLSLGSLNFHRDYFGTNFQISLNGESIHTGCVAFGLERWIYAFLEQFGQDQENWPNLELITI